MEEKEYQRELKTIIFFLPKADKEAIRNKAKSCRLSISSYCRFILNKSLKEEI